MNKPDFTGYRCVVYSPVPSSKLLESIKAEFKVLGLEEVVCLPSESTGLKVLFESEDECNKFFLARERFSVHPQDASKSKGV